MRVAVVRPDSPLTTPGSPTAAAPHLTDHQLIVLAAHDPESAQAELAARDAFGIHSPNSVRNAVAAGLAGTEHISFVVSRDTT